MDRTPDSAPHPDSAAPLDSAVPPDEPWLLRVLRGEEPSIRGRAARAALAALTPAYAAAVAARNAAFNLGLRRVHQLPHPVISVGNLSAGGTGKTPCVAEVVRALIRLGRRPAVLMRGYRAQAHPVTGGDEAALYARDFGDAVPVGANPDRLAAALELLRRRPEIDAFVLDDGFQHRRIHRDLDLLLIDGESWGRDRLIPAGLMREPRAAIRRADLVIVTHADRGRDALEALRASCRQPVLAARHVWTGLLRADGERLPLEAIAGRRVLAVCGIGKPSGFAHALHQLASPVSELIVRPDHASYDRAQLSAWFQRAHATGCEALLTTEKDWVKWMPLLDTQPQLVPESLHVLRPVLRFEIEDPQGHLTSAIAKAVGL